MCCKLLVAGCWLLVQQYQYPCHEGKLPFWHWKQTICVKMSKNLYGIEQLKVSLGKNIMQ